MAHRRPIAGLVLAGLVAFAARSARGYVEAPYAIGRIVAESTNILLIRVDKVDKEKNLIVFAKVQDLKGKHPADQVKHNIGRGGFHPREWQTIMAWAEPGQVALFFHNGGIGEVCINNYWYQVVGGDWWGLTHAEPYLLRSYAGRPEKLASAVATMLTGQEVVIPCMVDGDKNALQLRTAKVQRLKASLKIQDYNAARDFVGWGVEDFAAIAGMAGFSHIAALPRVSPDAGGVAPADFDGDGKVDFCLFGSARVVVVQNGGGSLNELPLAVEGGARAAAWADCDGDGKADLLLATPVGPKLLGYDGQTFRDFTAAIPAQPHYHLTAAAWMDYDGDGRQDILLADGFRGLRLYRNKGTEAARLAVFGLGKWHYAGPFDNPGGAGFDTAYPPEKEVNLSAEYTGKSGQKVVWREGKFRDGEVNDLALFAPESNENAAVYLYREIDFGQAVDLPVSLGSDDTLTVWLNGRKVHAENVARPCAPDQAKLTLKLKPGRNRLLIKICQATGGWAFYFSAKSPPPAVPVLFEDVSDQVGLGESGLGGQVKGDHLAVADVNGDGRPDFLYSVGTGLLALNTPQGFVNAQASGISYRAGQTAPVFGDYNGDGRADLFVPQDGTCRLFRNDGKGKFTDVTGQAGALARPIGWATSAAWCDFSGTGRMDLLIGCLKGPNRYFRNKGDGTFSDATEEIGLQVRIFNSRGLAAADINRDGVPDVVFVNEGQDSTALLGSPARMTAPAGTREASGR